MKRMKRFPLMITVIEGVLHSCALTESGVPLLEYGCLHWVPVTSDASEEFLEEAENLLQKQFQLKE